MLQNKSTTSWLSYSFSHHRTKHSSSSSKWKAPTILISLLIDCYGRKKITTYIFIFANLNAFLLKLYDFWLLPFHFTSHWGTAKSISCLVRRIPIRGPAWLCLGGNGVSRPQFPKWSFTAVPFFWALQIRLPRSFFTWSSPRRKKSMKFSEKKYHIKKSQEFNETLAFSDKFNPSLRRLEKANLKKILEQIGAFVPTRATPKSTLVTDKWTSTSPVRTEKSLDMNGEDGKDMYRKMNGNQ